jgi:hypothetical protein
LKWFNYHSLEANKRYFTLKTEIAITKWNLIVLAGWFVVVLGIFGIILHLSIFTQNQNAVWLGVFGVVNGLLMVKLGGPIKITHLKK